ncbi:MAG: hypothetical protein AABZ60_03060 [Planctomycetota bacterium]
MSKKFRNTFSLFELIISLGLFSVLMLATMNTLIVAQRTETMQIRRTILAVEAKKAQMMIQKDIEASEFRSIDVIQRYISIAPGSSDTAKTWSHCDDFTAAEVTTAFGKQFKRCDSNLASKPNCGWNFRRQSAGCDPLVDEYRFPYIQSAMQYSYSKTGSLVLGPGGGNVTLSHTGRVWAGVENETLCPIDQATLSYDKMPIKAVKMLTSRDRIGRRRTFTAGPKFGTPDWQGFVFYVNMKTPNSPSGKLLRYTIYKDDLDLDPRTLDLGTDALWNAYELYNGTQLDVNGNPTPPAIKPETDGNNNAPNLSGEAEVLNDSIIFGASNFTNSFAAGGSILPSSGPAIGIPSLMDLFDFNRNGDLECFPIQLKNLDYNPHNISDVNLISGSEASQEIFRVRIGPSGTAGEIPAGDPYLEWSKEKTLLGVVAREFYIRINLRTNDIFWFHKFLGNSDEGGVAIVNWDRFRSFNRKPDVVANNVVQWEMTTSRSTQEFWNTAAFDIFPRQPSLPLPFYGTGIAVNTEVQTDSPYVGVSLDLLRVAMDRYVRLVIVFDRPYIEGGVLKHEEYITQTGFSAH